MNIFKKKTSPKDALRTSKREMAVATRGIEREIASLQLEEKKLVAEIKKTATTGNELEDEEEISSLSNEKILKIFSSFMSRITKFEELVDVGNKYLNGFQQGLEFLRRPPIDMTSEIVECVLKANMTRRLTSYIEAGCLNPRDSEQNMKKFFTCHLGLMDNLNEAEIVMRELQGLVDDATEAVQASIHDLPCRQNKDTTDFDVNFSATGCNRKFEMIDYAALIAFIYGMIKQDCEMQKKIVSSLSLKSSSGELESYCQMWSLRPYVDDEVMQKAWELLP